MRIREKIMDKCMKRTSFFEEETTFRTSLVDQFQCLVDVLGKVSKDNDLKGLWTKNKPQFQTHLDSWKKCADEENKLDLILYVYYNNFFWIALEIRFHVKCLFVFFFALKFD